MDLMHLVVRVAHVKVVHPHDVHLLNGCVRIRSRGRICTRRTENGHEGGQEHVHRRRAQQGKVHDVTDLRIGSPYPYQVHRYQRESINNRERPALAEQRERDGAGGAHGVLSASGLDAAALASRSSAAGAG